MVTGLRWLTDLLQLLDLRLLGVHLLPRQAAQPLDVLLQALQLALRLELARACRLRIQLTCSAGRAPPVLANTRVGEPIRTTCVLSWTTTLPICIP